MLSNSHFTKKAFVSIVFLCSGMGVYANDYTQDYEETVPTQEKEYSKAAAVEMYAEEPYYSQYTTDYEEVVPYHQEEAEEYIETVEVISNQQPVFITQEPTVIHHEPVIIYQQPTPQPIFVSPQPTVIHHHSVPQPVFITPQPAVIHHEPMVIHHYHTPVITSNPTVTHHESPVVYQQAHAVDMKHHSQGSAGVCERINRLTKTILSSFCVSAFAVAHNCTLKHVINCFAATYGKFGLLGELGMQLFCDRYPQGILNNACLSAVSFAITKAIYEYCQVNNIHMQRLMKQSIYMFTARCIIEAMSHALTANQKKIS